MREPLDLFVANDLGRHRDLAMCFSRAVRFGLGGLVATPLVVRLSDRRGRKNTMITGMIIYIAGIAMIYRKIKRNKR